MKLKSNQVCTCSAIMKPQNKCMKCLYGAGSYFMSAAALMHASQRATKLAIAQELLAQGIITVDSAKALFNE